MELQQRAVEYMSLERKPDLARSNVVAMPPWEKRKSLLLRRMAAREVRESSPLLGPHPYIAVRLSGFGVKPLTGWLHPCLSDSPHPRQCLGCRPIMA